MMVERGWGRGPVKQQKRAVVFSKKDHGLAEGIKDKTGLARADRLTRFESYPKRVLPLFGYIVADT